MKQKRLAIALGLAFAIASFATPVRAVTSLSFVDVTQSNAFCLWMFKESAQIGKTHPVASYQTNIDPV